MRDKNLVKRVSVDSIVFTIISFDPGFKDSNFTVWISAKNNFLYGYLERNNFCIRKKTHVAQKECDVELCLDFTTYVTEINHFMSIHPDFVINMDETPCYYENRPNCNVVTKGAKSVNGAKTKTGDYRATVCLASSASGKKLMPLVIFKGQPGRSKNHLKY